MAKGLTLKQERFVDEYLIDGNATQAAIRAGYSEKTAEVIGHENLSKPKIGQAIRRKRKNLSEKVEVTQEYVIESIVRIAKKAEESGNHQAALKGMNMLAKHLGMYIERSESTHEWVLRWDDPEALPAEQAKLEDPTVIEGEVVGESGTEGGTT